MNVKSHVLEAILNNYEIKNGEKVTYEKIEKIIENTNLLPVDFKKCFGIHWRSYSKIRKGMECSFYARLYTTEEYKEIKKEILKQFQKKTAITYQEIQNLQKKYKIGETNIREIFNIPKEIEIEKDIKIDIIKIPNYYKKIEKEILNKYKQKQYISNKEIKDIEKTLTKEQIQKVFKINEQDYEKLKKNKIKKIEIDLLTKQDKQIMKKEIMKYITKKDTITLDDLEIIKEKTKYTDYQIKKALGVNPEKYKYLKLKRMETLDLITHEEERKIYFLSLDLRLLYKYGQRDYSKQEIDNICKEYKITKNMFIKYIIGTKKSYRLMKKAFDKCKNTWYLGENKNASTEFIEKLYQKSDQKFEYQAKNLIYTYHIRESFEELKQATYAELMDIGGKVEINFADDEELALNIMTKRGKYCMFKYLTRNQRELSLIVKTQNGELDLLDIIEDNTYNPELLIEEKRSKKVEDMTESHSKIVEQIKKYSYLIIENRKKGINKIAENLEMDNKELNEKLLEIQSIILDSGLVRYDKKGRIIQMEAKEI